ncbi:DUF4172 domain-containing protein [Rhizobium leguminosarum]|uniref:DUF4172 domain-containing protein n=1 Tax=Rhizobium leguminosarum TaxID=384 RepID=UPI00391ADCA4
MKWNWTSEGWPHFIYVHAPLEPLESRFLLSSGEVIGAIPRTLNVRPLSTYR